MGKYVHPKNLVRVHGIPKLIELGLLTLLVIITRAGNNGKPIFVGEDGADAVNNNIDATIFSFMVIYGYYFILYVQLLGLLLNEPLNFQNLVITGFGSVFFIAVGAVQIHYTANNAAANLAQGSICIITGVVYLVDSIVIVWKHRKDGDF